MAKCYITLKYEDFKEKFKRFLVHRKKVTAIENYVSVAPLAQQFERTLNNYLRHIKFLLANQFIDEIEESYLNARLTQLNVEAMDWCHKTNWLKKEMAHLEKKKYPALDQMVLPLPEFQRSVPRVLPTPPVTQRRARA